MIEMQKDFFEVIDKEINNNRISHAYLIETGEFDQLDEFINVFVKKLLKVSENDKNINTLIDNNNYPDLKIIDADGTFIKKEQLLDVKDTFSKDSIYNNKKIYVIKDASKLNASSGNTILKFLEEPTDDIVAILLAKNRYNVLETIISRCQVFRLNDSKSIEFSDTTMALVKTLFEKNKGFLAFNDIIELVPDKKTFEIEFRFIQKYLFELVNCRQDLAENTIIFDDNKLYQMILIVEKYLNKCEFNVNYKLLIDSLLVEVGEVIK